MSPGPAVPGCSFISLHFLRAILCPLAVMCSCIHLLPTPMFRVPIQDSDRLHSIDNLHMNLNREDWRGVRLKNWCQFSGPLHKDCCGKTCAKPGRLVERLIEPWVAQRFGTYDGMMGICSFRKIWSWGNCMESLSWTLLLLYRQIPILCRSPRNVQVCVSDGRPRKCRLFKLNFVNVSCYCSNCVACDNRNNSICKVNWNNLSFAVGADLSIFIFSRFSMFRSFIGT